MHVHFSIFFQKKKTKENKNKVIALDKPGDWTQVILQEICFAISLDREISLLKPKVVIKKNKYVNQELPIPMKMCYLKLVTK